MTSKEEKSIRNLLKALEPFVGSRGEDTRIWKKLDTEYQNVKEMVNSPHPEFPICPKCGSPKLQCPNGHSWEIRT